MSREEDEYKAALRWRIELLEGALTGCVDLIERWMNGVFKDALGIVWEEPPPALKRAKEILGTPADSET